MIEVESLAEAFVQYHDGSFGRTALGNTRRAYLASVRTSQETHDVSATRPNRLVLFRETVAVYCENHMEHANMYNLYGENKDFFVIN
jgi:hypothetical protein